MAAKSKEAGSYRERIGAPGWAGPLIGAIGVLWTLRRIRKTLKNGPAWRKVLSIISAVSTLLAIVRLLRRFEYIAVEVEDEAIRLAAGPIEKRIPVRSIRDVRIATYNPLRFLGWGYRIGLGGRRAFSQLGVRRGVEITAQEDGRQRRYFVSSNDPEALAGAVATVAGVSAEA